MNDFSHYYFFMIDEYSGEILSALIENMSGDVKVLLDGDMIYYTCEQYVTYGGETENVISLRAYNMTLGAYMFAPRNYQKFAVNDILVNSDCIFIYDNNMVVVLDKKTGDPLNIYSTVNKIVFGWIMKDRLYYLFDNGSLYMCDNKWMYDQSEKFFSHIPSGTRITDAHFIDEKLYCMFNSDYLVRYSNDINSDAIAVEEKYEWERNEDSVTSDPREIFTIPRKEKDIIKDAVFSEDKKFILAEYENAIYKILDTESGDVRYVFRSDSLYDDDQNFIYMKLSYNEIFGKYVLHTKKHSYVFNDDFNILCVTPRIVDGLDDRLIMLDDSGKAYSVPYVSPEELVQQTQNALIGYEPLANILQEYNIRN